MIVVENIDPWAPQFNQFPKVLRLILDSWETFKMPTRRLEVPITKKFCAHLCSNKDRSIHFFRIDWESYVLDEGGEVKGRIDLRFSEGYDENVYFSLECKLLRVNRPSGFASLAGKYVTEGMFRYFNGQYAAGLDKGGMLGYVMDGQIDAAIDDVSTAIENRRLDLYMGVDETLRRSSCLSSAQVRETRHNYGPSEEFVVYHVFVKCGAN